MSNSKREFSKCVLSLVENLSINQVPNPSKSVIILSERLKYCLWILKIFGYFPFSFDQKGFIKFRFLGLQFLYSATIAVLYVVGFIHLFLLGNTFDELFKEGKRVLHRVDFSVFLGEAFLSCLIFLILVFESWLRQANFVSFWNNLQHLLNDIGDLKCYHNLRREATKLMILYGIGTLSFCVIMSTGKTQNDPELNVSRVDIIFMGIWTLYAISYIYLYVYCTLIIYTLTLSFGQVEKLIKEGFATEDKTPNSLVTSPKHCMDQENKIYSALDKFEKTADLLKQFQSSFGLKLLISVSKLCFSTFLTMRLIILLMKGNDRESSIILESAILHSAHLWGLSLLVALCYQTQKMTHKANECLESIKIFKLAQVCPQRVIPVVNVFLTQMRANSYSITANGLINIDWTLFVSMTAVIISYSVILENFGSVPPG